MRSPALRPLALMLLLMGCASIVSARESFAEHGLQRAAFDLDCPPDALQVVQLAQGHRAGLLQCTGAQVGVRGCGRHAVYVCGQYQEWHADARPQ
jgi:hypothetical protein